jgi:hypothetical protein
MMRATVGRPFYQAERVEPWETQPWMRGRQSHFKNRKEGHPITIPGIFPQPHTEGLKNSLPERQ